MATQTAAAEPFDRRLVWGIAPAIAAVVIFEFFLGHRHDYTGHFAAGYGGTYGALLFGLKFLPPRRFTQRAPLALLGMCLACILLGVVTEATAFRIAKFDEIDFCNQSLGAVLAALAAMPLAAARPTNVTFDYGLILGIAFLGIGACYAVA